eukprot:2603662-Pyramimonas_sp.AAC.1
MGMWGQAVEVVHGGDLEQPRRARKVKRVRAGRRHKYFAESGKAPHMPLYRCTQGLWGGAT